MVSHGIFHQASCVYTLQQNRVDEHKNRHLLKQLTLLIHGEVPQCFCDDTILTICYLISHTPSSVLDNKILHSILFSHEPLHSLFLKSFWFVCFVHSFSPSLDKLSH